MQRLWIAIRQHIQLQCHQPAHPLLKQNSRNSTAFLLHGPVRHTHKRPCRNVHSEHNRKVKELREGYEIKRANPTAKLRQNLSDCVKLSSFTTEPQLGQLDHLDNAHTDVTRRAPDKRPSSNIQRSHLLSLNQQEALMLFSLMQAALRHEPTRRTLLSTGDYKQFHRQLSQSLAKSLAAA